jgi:hypothetical protein
MTHKSSSGIPAVHDEIARRAYHIYLERGSEPGHDLDDWLKAEAQVAGHPGKAGGDLEVKSAPWASSDQLPGGSIARTLDAREHPYARDERGSASREDIRRQTVVAAPRQSQRRPEKSR